MHSIQPRLIRLKSLEVKIVPSFKHRWFQCRPQTLLLIHEVAEAEAEEADFELLGLGAGEELGSLGARASRPPCDK